MNEPTCEHPHIEPATIWHRGTAEYPAGYRTWDQVTYRCLNCGATVTRPFMVARATGEQQ